MWPQSMTRTTGRRWETPCLSSTLTRVIYKWVAVIQFVETTFVMTFIQVSCISYWNILCCTRLHILLLCVYVCVRGAAYTQLATILTRFLILTLKCLHSLQHLFGIIASVLHLGNVQFEADSKGYATLNKNTELRWVSTVSLVIPWTLRNDTMPKPWRPQSAYTLLTLCCVWSSVVAGD